MLPTIAYALLDAIAISETAHPLDYNQLADHKTFDDFSDFPEWAGIQFDTIRSYAAGRYRLEPATWKMIAANIGVLDFSPTSQDHAAWWLAKRDYAMYIHRDLELDLINNNTRYLHAGLSRTWPYFNDTAIYYYMGAYIARGMILVYPAQINAPPPIRPRGL